MRCRFFVSAGCLLMIFRTVDDIRKLPPMTKQDYMRDPESFRLDPSRAPDLTLEERTIADIIYTAGSSGEPTPFYDTVHDRYARIDLMARATRIAGIGPADTIMNLFPLSGIPHQGFLSATWGPMATGSKLLSGLTGRALCRLSRAPAHGRGHRPHREPARYGAVGHHLVCPARDHARRGAGQGLQRGAARDGNGRALPHGHARRHAQARLTRMGSTQPTVNNGYGMTELMGPSTECRENGGAHLPAPEQFYFRGGRPGDVCTRARRRAGLAAPYPPEPPGDGPAALRGR